MKLFRVCLVLGLILCSTAWSQKPGPPEKSPDGGDQKPPTLGPAPPPSLNGPRSSNTTDPQRLNHVRKIYVERIDNSLSDKLMEGLAKKGRFSIVADVKEADAVLRGTCFDSHRLKSVHSEVFISDRVTGASIWQDNVRRSFNPPALQKAVDDTAEIILEHLNESVREAQRK
jgi:hypothetical protein